MTNGLMLISGGIDSPVASSILNDYDIEHKYVHFMSNYDDEISKTKISNIIRQLNKKYKRGSQIYYVDIGKLQKIIAEKYKDAYRVLLYKIFMIKIANYIAKKDGMTFIITGNSWGQVSSQVGSNIYMTELFSDLPIFSPLIADNKTEIIEHAKLIGTFSHSICNANDCCVTYLTHNPILNASQKYINDIVFELNFNDYITIYEEYVL